MKFKIQVTDGGSPWWEEYDKATDDAQSCAEQMIENFNNTLQSHEKPRTLLAVEVLDRNSIAEHDWEKTNSFSVRSRGMLHDTYRCRRCGITGKRAGLNPSVGIDSKFRAKVYKRCDTAKAHLDKKRQAKSRDS